MKLLIEIILLGIVSSVHAQVPNTKRILKVIWKEEYPDGALLRAIDTLSHDTISVCSQKSSSSGISHLCKEVEVGKTYSFQLRDEKNNMAPIENLTIRLKSTIIWRSTDGYKRIPFFAQNMSGLCIWQ